VVKEKWQGKWVVGWVVGLAGWLVGWWGAEMSGLAAFHPTC